MEEKHMLDVVSIRLVKDAPILSSHKIQTPEDAIAVVGDYLCEMDREVFCVINLKADNTPINCNIASIGTLNCCIAEPRELFKSSILSNAAKMLLVHVHPSGNLLPSKEDTRLTERMIGLCSMMGIPLIDHIIVGGDNRQYFSFLEKEILTNPHHEYRTDYRELSFNVPAAAEAGR